MIVHQLLDYNLVILPNSRVIIVNGSQLYVHPWVIDEIGVSTECVAKLQARIRALRAIPVRTVLAMANRTSLFGKCPEEVLWKIVRMI